MSIWSRIQRAVKPLDTSEACVAIDAAARANRDMKVQARALRMDVGCGRELEVVRGIIEQTCRGAGGFLRVAFAPDHTMANAEYQELLRRLGEIEY